MSAPFKVRIAAGGISKWIGEATNPFSEHEADAIVFTDSIPDFCKYVLSDAAFDDFEGGKTYTAIGLEKIEFVY